MRRVAVTLTMAVASLTSGMVSPAAAAPVDVAKSACTIPGASEATMSSLARASAPAPADGIQAHEQWLADPDTQRFNQRLQTTTAALLGAEPARGERIADRLRRGLIGYAADHSSHRLVAVVTPESGLTTTLGASVNTLQRSLTTVTTYPAAATVVTGCHTAASLIEADNLLFARSWHPDAAKAYYTYRLDPADSIFHVSFDARYPAAADALKAALGDRVDVKLGALQSLTGRYDDGEPHYGGAGIRVGAGTTSNNTCTSGFMIKRNSDGRKGMAAAGHCFSNGQSIYSGPQFYGTTADESASYDAIGIYSTTETYAPIIHVEPCSPCTRTVIGSEVPGWNTYVCTSGMVTTAVCSIQVLDPDASACFSTCLSGLIYGYRGDRTIVAPGDSGGPMYTRPGSTTARIDGMVIGQDPYFGGNYVYAERTAAVLTGLGATLVTG